MTGTLSIIGGISRLGSKRLMKGAIDNGGFGRATNFLEVDRQLRNNDTISVDGTNVTFGAMPVILITDARKVSVAAAKARRSVAKKRAAKAVARKSAKATKKTGSKARKSTKSTTTSARKATGSKKKRARAK